jgi:hypothetical protein
VIPEVYRTLLRDRRTRRLLAGLGVSSLGDGMSTVTIAWLAVQVAPAGELGAYVGLALAAYTLPGVIGALAFTRFVRHRPARALVLVHCLLRAGFLGVIALLWALDALAPSAYVPLLAGSSLMAAWGNAGQYTMLAELGGPDGRLAVNSLASAQVSFAVIVGPALAGLLIAGIGPDGWSRWMRRRSPSSASRPGAHIRAFRPPSSRSILMRRSPASGCCGGGETCSP